MIRSIFNIILLITISCTTIRTKDEGVIFEKECVIVLHGITKDASNMKKMAEYIEKNDYTVYNLSYPSTQKSIDELIENIHQQILNLNIEESTKINFVAHSMGGLITRGLIHKYRPKKLGRVVMLATPNNGSEIADLLLNNNLYKKAYGPAGQQLTTNNNSYKDKFGKIDYELGIIAGRLPLNPVTPFIVPGSDDGIVSVESTKIEGMKDHIVITANHNFIMYNKEAMEQTVYFLKNGKFRR